jgi:hypothetical protein
VTTTISARQKTLFRRSPTPGADRDRAKTTEPCGARRWRPRMRRVVRALDREIGPRRSATWAARGGDDGHTQVPRGLCVQMWRKKARTKRGGVGVGVCTLCCATRWLPSTPVPECRGASRSRAVRFGATSPFRPETL